MAIHPWTVVRLLDPVGSTANPGPPQNLAWRPPPKHRIRRKPVPEAQPNPAVVASPQPLMRRSISERPATWVAPAVQVLDAAQQQQRARDIASLALPAPPRPPLRRSQAPLAQAAAPVTPPAKPARRMSAMVQKLFKGSP